MPSSEFKFCWCGRPKPCTSKYCCGKEKPKPKKKVGKYSGFSQFKANGDYAQ